MQTEQVIALDFYEAVLADNGIKVQNILNYSLHSSTKIPVRTITGMLIIAVEKKLSASIKAILNYNEYSNDKIIDKHLDAILCIAAKSGALKNLEITYH